MTPTATLEGPASQTTSTLSQLEQLKKFTVVVADTGGPTTGNLTLLDYRKRPRPLFPFELE